MNFFTSSFKPQHFLLFVGICFFLVAGAVVFLNGWFYFNEPNSDLSRAMQAEQGGYEVIVIGSSRANAFVPYFEDGSSALKVLNLSAGGATPYEIKRRLEHSLRYSKPRQILIGLDFFSFNSYWPGSETYSDYFFTTQDTKFELLHRIKRFALYSTSYKNLFKNLENIDLFFLRKKAEESKEEQEKDSGQSNKEAFLKTEAFYMQNGYNPTPYKQYNLGDDIFDEQYKEILKLGYDHDINLLLVTSPIHTRLVQIIDIMGLWDDFEEWKTKLVQLNENVGKEYDRSAFNIYDAMIYTDATRVDFEKSVKLYTENSHFTPYFASEILKLISRAPGKNSKHYSLISSKNIAGHLENQRKARDKHNKKHPALYEDLAQKYVRHQEAKNLLQIR